jgi:hypothetical protein
LAASNQMQILGNENFGTKANVAVYPNPSVGNFSITNSEGIKTVRAFDLLGKEVNVNSISNNQFSIENKGIYFLKVIFQNGEETSSKISIN